MAASLTVPVNPARLVWARREAEYDLSEAARALHVDTARLLAWEAGDLQPTLNQVRTAAGVYRRTLAWLITPGDAPAPSDGAVADFRGLGTDRVGPSLGREIRRAQDRRSVMLDLQPTPPGVLPAIPDVLGDPENSADRFLAALPVLRGVQVGGGKPADALRAWIADLEDVGVLVFQMSRIDPAEECKGISLHHDLYPLVVLNGSDSEAGRLFTLLHETAHLLDRSSGLCQVLGGPDVERRCNLFAGAVLMPRAEFVAAVSADREPADQLAEVARRFNVSQSAAAIRMRDLGLTSQDQLDQQLALARMLAARARERDRDKSSGPPHHLVHLRNLGPTYVGHVLDAMHRREISEVDAAYFLESKLSTVDRMAAEIERRALTA